MMPSTYERMAAKILKGQPRPKPIGRLIGHHFSTGTMSLHRTVQSRRWQLFWRMKFRR